MEKVREYYSLKKKVLVSLVAGGSEIVKVIVLSGFMKFFTDVVGLSPGIYVSLFVVFTIWNAINDPLIGYWADKQRFIDGKGKYKHLMRKAIPLFAIPVVLLLFVPSSLSDVWISIILLLLMVLYEAGQTLLNVSFNAFKINTFTMMSERNSMQAISTYVVMIPVFIAGAVPMIFLTQDYSRTAIVIAFLVAISVGILLTVIGAFFVKEDKTFYDNIEVSKGLHELWAFFKKFMKDRVFITFLIAIFFIWIPAGNTLIGYLYYMDDVLNVDNELMILIPDILTGIGQMAMFPIVVWLAKKFGSRNALAYGLAVSVLALLTLSLKINYWVAAPTFVVLLLGYSFSSVLSVPLQGLVVDHVEIKTGKRQPGNVGGIVMMFVILASSVQQLVLGWFLEKANYETLELYKRSLLTNPDLTTKEWDIVNALTPDNVNIMVEQVSNAVRISTGLVPAICLLIGIVVLLFVFPIGKKQEKEIHDQITLIHKSNK